jgi:hypothetical protein
MAITNRTEADEAYSRNFEDAVARTVEDLDAERQGVVTPEPQGADKRTVDPPGAAHPVPGRR